MRSRDDHARHFLGLIEDEHHTILGKLRLAVAWEQPEKHLGELKEVCGSIRLHLAAESGVLVPKLAAALGSSRMLTRAGLEFRVVLTLLNDIEHSPKAAVDRPADLAQLMRLFSKHVAYGEGKRGLHERAHAAPGMDWVAIEAEYCSRRSELEGHRKPPFVRYFALAT